jgi:hypothetical protein
MEAISMYTGRCKLVAGVGFTTVFDNTLVGELTYKNLFNHQGDAMS